MTSRPRSYEGTAFNTHPDSPNRIHSDEVARQYGFEGGLVPGVTVTAYVVDPAVRAWGSDFLERGYSRVTCEKPLYDGRRFRVAVEPQGESAYDAALVCDPSVRLASGHVALVERIEPPQRRGDRPAGERDPVEPTESGMRELMKRGMGSIAVPFEPGSLMATYFRDEADMPDLVRPSLGGYANVAFLLGLTNWSLAANVRLGPWIHLETEARYLAPARLGETLAAEGTVVDLFERKGHRFCDIDVSAFSGDRAVMRARLRAIYRLRPVAS